MSVSELDKPNICQGGPVNGFRFPNSRGATRITYREGVYIKSAISNQQGQVIWTWHPNKKTTETK